MNTDPQIPFEKEENSSFALFGGWKFKTMLVTVLLSIAGYFLFTIWAGWHQVLSGIAHIGLPGIALALLLSLTNYGLRFLRWRLFLRHLGHSIPWKIGARIYLSGFALTITPGKSGEAVRGVFLKGLGVPLRSSFGIFFAERAFDLISVALLAAGGLWVHSETRPVLLVVLSVLLLLVYLVRSEQRLKRSAQFLKTILPLKLASPIDYFLEISLAFRSCTNPSSLSLLRTVVLGLIAWGAEALSLYMLLTILGHSMSVVNAFFIYGFSLVIGGITLLPGGLGGAELAMLELLQSHQIGLSDAVTVTLMIRLTTLWFSVFLGMLAFPKKNWPAVMDQAKK